MTYALTTVRRTAMLDLAGFGRATGLHPDLVRRLVELGVLDATATPSGELLFAPRQVPLAARVRRLQAGFALNYAALDLVLHLLDRIEQMESATLARPHHRGGPTWT
jgi:chaperone modulatory protein CbpM